MGWNWRCLDEGYEMCRYVIRRSLKQNCGFDLLDVMKKMFFFRKCIFRKIFFAIS